MGSSLQTFVKSVCVQTAVYWSAPTSDGTGGWTYCDPVEISCRWDSVIKRITNNKGIEVMSKARLLVTQDVDIDGMVFLGSLYELYEQGNGTSPEDVDGAHKIQLIEKTPEFKSTSNFVREVYL